MSSIFCDFHPPSNSLAPFRQGASSYLNQWCGDHFACRCPSNVLTEKLTSFQVLLAFLNIHVQFNGTSLATKRRKAPCRKYMEF